jgi:ribosomal protein S18 acetylase RimI-like enzyme
LPTIRHARRGDAGPLAKLAEATFRSTFAASNTPQNMDRHCSASYSEAIQGQEIARPDMLTFLCEEGAELVGFAQLRWGDAPGCVVANAPSEVQRLYVIDAWHGRGVARDLMNACLDEVLRRGSDVVWLGVWERNPRAIAFYKKYGFEEVGAHVFPLGDDPQRDLVMARPVSR